MSTIASASQAVLDATYSAYDPKDPITLRRCVAAALLRVEFLMTTNEQMFSDMEARR